MSELVVEFLSEEIPARMQAAAVRDIARIVGEKLTEARLEHGDVKAYATPRRITVHVDRLASVQSDIKTERKGPRTDAPQKALDGFLRSTGLTLDECEVREDKKGSYYVAVIEQKGRPVADILSELVVSTATELTWPKSMRWASNGFRWVRPLHNVLAVFDRAVLPGALDLGNDEVVFTNETSGHRFLDPGRFSVDGFDDYVAKLERAHVILDPEKRRAMIAADASSLATQAGMVLTDDPGLLDEVAGLVEWPTTLIADIDEEFMSLPPEVMTAAMRNHQKYFSLTHKGGGAAPKFIFVANGMTETSEAQIVVGNERVLKARLADARHFWEQDRKTSLAAHAAALGDIVFHAQLGTLDQKVDRVQALAVALTEFIPGADKDRVRSAARLAKADLVTEMVGEFPELQGTVGRYYAAADGEHDEVAQAIADHYAPAGPDDTCPTAPVSIAVAMADKLDTLFWLWAHDVRPTGSKDPFALRRAALGLIRLILENGLRLKLSEAFALARQTPAGDVDAEPGHKLDEAMASLTAFFGDRLKVHLRKEGVRHDTVASVFALAGEDDLVRIVALVRALTDFLGSTDGANLLTAYKRAANIVRQEEKKDATQFDGAAYDPALAEAEEAELWAVLKRVEDTSQPLLEKEAFADMMAQLAKLRQPVDRFFDAVKVNVDDANLRANRLRLLARIVAVMDKVAIFAEIEG
ncbi:MAG: glycine--tRNA ligase subunit beta [Alphaproteobacteria bacterium]|nr:glycine--tRNA ligase subunit beta [Alphaproteobacteria bacterium]